MLVRRLLPCLALLAVPRIGQTSERFIVTDMGGQGAVELTEWLVDVEWPSITHHEDQERWTPLSVSFRIAEGSPIFTMLNRQVILQIRAGRGMRGNDRFSVRLGRDGMSAQISGARLLHVDYGEDMIGVRIEFSSAVMT